MAKKAVLIGCNYPGTKAELKGCINDVKRMQKCLIDRYAFSPSDITVLIDDTNDPSSQPTGKNIRTAVSSLIRSAHPGDFLFLHYSGHGTRLPAESGDADDTGYDECIVPSDMNLITDDDFREFVDQIPKGCRITIVSDSCHSGGLVDESKEQIGQSTKRHVDDDSSSGSRSGLKCLLQQTVQGAFETRRIHIHQKDDDDNDNEDVEENRPPTKPRSLPLSTLIEILNQKTGKADINVGTLRPSLFNIFGEDASPKVQKFMSIILNKVQQKGNNGGNAGVLGMVGNLAQEFLKQKFYENDNNGGSSTYEVYAGTKMRELPDGGILISGCQTDETSADASPVGGKAYGAFSNAIQVVLEEFHEKITNQDLVMKARAKLKSQGFNQQPGLYCSDHHVDLPFVC